MLFAVIFAPAVFLPGVPVTVPATAALFSLPFFPVLLLALPLALLLLARTLLLTPLLASPVFLPRIAVPYAIAATLSALALLLVPLLASSLALLLLPPVAALPITTPLAPAEFFLGVSVRLVASSLLLIPLLALHLALLHLARVALLLPALLLALAKPLLRISAHLHHIVSPAPSLFSAVFLLAPLLALAPLRFALPTLAALLLALLEPEPGIDAVVREHRSSR